MAWTIMFFIRESSGKITRLHIDENKKSQICDHHVPLMMPTWTRRTT